MPCQGYCERMGHRHTVVQADLSPAPSFRASEPRVNGCGNLGICCPLHRDLHPDFNFAPPLVELGRGAIVCARIGDHLFACRCRWCSLSVGKGRDMVLQVDLPLRELLDEEL